MDEMDHLINTSFKVVILIVIWGRYDGMHIQNTWREKKTGEMDIFISKQMHNYTSFLTTVHLFSSTKTKFLQITNHTGLKWKDWALLLTLILCITQHSQLEEHYKWLITRECAFVKKAQSKFPQCLIAQ